MTGAPRYYTEEDVMAVMLPKIPAGYVFSHWEDSWVTPYDPGVFPQDVGNESRLTTLFCALRTLSPTELLLKGEFP